jgi:hypothetical protein
MIGKALFCLIFLLKIKAISGSAHDQDWLLKLKIVFLNLCNHIDFLESAIEVLLLQNPYVTKIF